jgi:hypothetical protein
MLRLICKQLKAGYDKEFELNAANNLLKYMISIIIIIIIIMIMEHTHAKASIRRGRCHSVVESSSTHRQRSYSK